MNAPTDLSTNKARGAGMARLRPLRGLWPYLRPYLGIVVAALCALVLAAGALLAMPLSIGRVIDAGVNSPSVNTYFMALFGLAALAGSFAALRFYLVSWLGERVVADLRSAVFRHVLKLDPAFFEVTRSGEILSRLTTDTTLIQNVVGSSLSIALRSLLTLSGALVMLAITSPQLTGLILILVPLVIGPIVLIGKRVRRLSRTSQDRIADTSALAGEVLNAMPLVQSFTLESLHGERYDDAVEASFGAARRRIRVRALLTAYAIITIFAGLIAVVWHGAQHVAAGTMSAGDLGQFLLYAVFVGGSSAGLSEVWGALQQAAGATERLLELLARQPAEDDRGATATLPGDARGALEFEHVSFNYPSRPHAPALSDFNLRLAPGETVALVGPSGAGKTTVLQLALAFYRPAQGRIVFDGTDIAEVTAASVRQRIAVVPQETMLFADTIAENIRYGRPGASDEAVVEAARAAGAEHFIAALPEGFATHVGERGVRLSGGQQQRLAIARAVLRDPALLLLDEATSALDADSELAVQTALAELMAGRTTLIVAHRLATVRDADRIVVMDHGRVVATGTHDDLMAGNSVYARFAALQFSEHEGAPAPAVINE